MNVAEEYIRDAIRREYMHERAGYRELIGTLYPGIVYCRLQELREKFQRAGGDLQQLPQVPPPNSDGRAPFFPIKP